jgi:hypothetical protein
MKIEIFLKKMESEKFKIIDENREMENQKWQLKKNKKIFIIFINLTTNLTLDVELQTSKSIKVRHPLLSETFFSKTAYFSLQ